MIVLLFLLLLVQVVMVTMVVMVRCPQVVHTTITSHVISLHIVSEGMRVDNSGKYPTMGGAACVACVGCVVMVEGQEGRRLVLRRGRQP